MMKRTTMVTTMLMVTMIQGFAAAVREKQNLDFDWQFTLSDDARYAQADFDDSAWRTVQLPHDWSITMPFDRNVGGQHAHLPGGIGWYRRDINAPVTWRGQRIGILFDGIYHQSDVYINGHHLGFRPYGFGYIDYDLTPYIKYGERNTIAVRVDHERPSEEGARWYTGSGIYRHAWLTLTQPVHVATYGTYVTSDSSGKVCVETTVANDGDNDAEATIEYRVYDAEGRLVVSSKAPLLHVQSGTSSTSKHRFDLGEVHLWSISDPYLYELSTTVHQGDRLVDELTTTFGVRDIAFSPTQGFLLNGERVKLKGLCLHQDDGCLGTAVPDRAYERRLEILKEYGCNALRMSHNQPSPELLDLCDRMGFVVIDEALDKWKSGYYAKYFDQWWQHDIRNMILRDRNHPSVVLWSIGNELQEAWDQGNEGIRRAEMLRDYVHGLEPTRPVNLAAQNNHNGAFSAVADVTGYNYLEERMISDHRRMPDHCFLVTEELPYFRGAEGNIRSYDENNPWNAVAENDWIAGGFIWVGVDYLGEAGWPSHGWPNGLFDITMHEKPRAAFHRAMWSDRPHVGMAVVNPGFDIDHGRDLWQWPNMADHWSLSPQYDGQVMEVRTTTNCDRVELWLNGKQMGSKQTCNSPNHTIKWNIPFQCGRLTARAFRGDVLVDSCSLVSAYKAERLQVKPDRTTLKADGQDLSFIALELTDAEGNPVQVDDRLVSVDVAGPARLRGVDAADLRRSSPFGSPAVKTCMGRAQAVVQTTREPGTIRVCIHVEGFGEAAVCELVSLRPGEASALRNEDGHKLWLRAPQSQHLATVATDSLTPTSQLAVSELEHYWKGVEPVTLLHDDRLPQTDGYSIRKGKDGSITVSASRDVGLLYGAYALLRSQQMGTRVSEGLSEPTFPLRILNHWDNLDGSIERGYAGRSIFWGATDDVPSDDVLRAYARANASVGINGTVLNNVNASPQILSTKRLEQVSRIADVLRPYGIKVYLSVNFASPIELGHLSTADPLNMGVQTWWRSKVAEIYRMIPDFGGFLVKANSEGQPGPGDYGRTHAEGANMLADVLARHGGVVMWRAFVYGYHGGEDRVKQAVDEFKPLDGSFRPNVILQIKNGPLDFQPREPYSPLFDQMAHTPMMAELQITQEYTGQSRHLVFLAPMWTEFFGFVDPASLAGVAGVANIGDDTNWCGHHFSQANWYAFGRLAWEPGLTSRQIADEWLRQTFTTDGRFLEPMTEVMLSSREACVDYMMPLGLHHIFMDGHHYGPYPEGNSPDFPDEWKPVWYHKADVGGIGFNRSTSGTAATQQYRRPYSELYDDPSTCPEVYLLWFHHLPWNYRMHDGSTLWQSLCRHYDAGVEAVRGMERTWHDMKPYVDNQRWTEVEERLRHQCDNAREWRDHCTAYFRQFAEPIVDKKKD